MALTAAISVPSSAKASAVSSLPCIATLNQRRVDVNVLPKNADAENTSPPQSHQR